MNKEDKSFLLFAAGATITLFGYIFRDMTILIIGLWIFAINQWFVFYRKTKKKKFYLLDFRPKWSTLKTLLGMMRDKDAYCWHSKELPNIKKQ